jgi:hypothetical protein
MAISDSLVGFRDAALACNDAAKNALALLQWINSGTGPSLAVFALPFPRGQSLPGRAGEPFEEAVRRGAVPKWIGELQNVLDDWNAAVRTPECLEQITRAAVSLHLPPLQIGIDSFATAHEAAHRRASELLYFLQGRVQVLPDEVRMDLCGRIEQEYGAAQNLWQAADAMVEWCKGDGNSTLPPAAKLEPSEGDRSAICPPIAPSGSRQPAQQSEIMDASLERLRQIAAEIRCLRQAFNCVPADHREIVELGAFVDEEHAGNEVRKAFTNPWIRNRQATAGSLLSEAISLGAFQGTGYATLRARLRHRRELEPDNWKWGLWDEAVNYLLPAANPDPSHWGDACGPIADLIDEEARKLSVPPLTANTDPGERNDAKTLAPVTITSRKRSEWPADPPTLEERTTGKWQHGPLPPKDAPAATIDAIARWVGVSEPTLRKNNRKKTWFVYKDTKRFRLYCSSADIAKRAEQKPKAPPKETKGKERKRKEKVSGKRSSK